MRTYEVKILGQRYKVKSDEGEEYINELADYVNEQLLEIQKGAKTVSTHNLAILAAVNIADSFFKTRDREQKANKEVRERIKKLLKLIRAGKNAESTD